MVYALLVIVGLCLGSFVNALVWRLHEQEERTPNKERRTKKKAKAVISTEVEGPRIQSEEILHPPWQTQHDRLSIIQGRSMCPECYHELAAKDLVPVLSWLWLKGRCRYCNKPISWQYPVVEGATTLLFVASYIYWPSGFRGAGLLEFVLWLVFLTNFMAMVVYDLRWYILPNRIVYPLLMLALVQVLVVSLFLGGGLSGLLGAFWGAVVLGGLFYAIFQVSHGKWIGGGDVKLGALLGLLVGGPLASFLLLFIASAGGTAVALPLLATGRAKRTTRLPFGPFLIIAAIIVRLFGASAIAWYKHSLGY